MKQETIRVLDVDVYCEYEWKNKPVMILIHGFLASTYSFSSITPELSKHYSILALDLPGFGQSEKSVTFEYSFKQYRQLIVAVMDYFDIDRAHLVGHSMGGQVALSVAKASPERVNTLMLLCSSGYLKRAKTWLRYSSYMPFFYRFVYRYFKRKDVRNVMEKVLYRHELITDEMMDTYTKPLLDINFHKSLTRLLRQREGDLSTEELQQISVPTLLIWGREDEIVPLKIGERLTEDLPNSQLEVFDESGHLVADERPNDVIRTINQFIENQQAGATSSK
ncbi:alpha/beta fold hydrolase [Alkalibacillus almallahensis]|uniref:alpha/beta fold hydrolase n=1 Tax=Alkalibacillus almallahensis TaxID=1379154 RepID=UPI0014238746|nr:alpha/beta hydrolase [Alkalibacillus almallahensis]NIK13112.1 pimeloyl-ACP methyl ester carboxylesterase [Alkalibacillus almallahensis]